MAIPIDTRADFFSGLPGSKKNDVISSVYLAPPTLKIR
jgi:hypothetical protein